MSDATIKLRNHGATETPSEQLVRSAAQEYTITDKRGRAIVIKQPGVLAQYRIVEAMGGEAAKNEVYMGMVLPIIYVASIDGLPVPLPSNKAQIEALIQRLDDDGLVAVSKGVSEHFGMQDPEADRDALKK